MRVYEGDGRHHATQLLPPVQRLLALERTSIEKELDRHRQHNLDDEPYEDPSDVCCGHRLAELSLHTF